MRAQQLRTIIISHADPALVQAALDKLRAGQGLTAAESGVGDVEPIRNLTMMGTPPQLLFDGQRYTQVLYVSAS
jgi:hypothetical protein